MWWKKGRKKGGRLKEKGRSSGRERNIGWQVICPDTVTARLGDEVKRLCRTR